MKKILELNNITIKNKNNFRLRGISFSVYKGDKIALMGSSGSGKTTLISVANGSQKPDLGTVKWKGKNLNQLKIKEKRLIGTIWQDLRLIKELNVCQNINVGALGLNNIAWAFLNLLLTIEKDKCIECMNLVNLQKRFLYSSIETLSGGEKQRLAIARTLRQEAELILADEPLSNLDPMLTTEILDLLLKKDICISSKIPDTTLISLHRPELIGDFNRVIGLKKGQIIFNESIGKISQHEINNLYRT